MIPRSRFFRDLGLALLTLAVGCIRAEDESAFRVAQQPQPSESAVPQQWPPLASHTSGVTGEVTPQVPAPPPSTPPALPAASAFDPANSSLGAPAPPGDNVVHQGAVGPDRSPPPAPSSPVTLAPQPPASFPIELSVPVALPMTGPEGTMMGFSVDYIFRGAPLGPGPYVWVIEGAPGRQYRLPVKLDARGNLMIVIPQWRPEDGPFRCRIEDQSGRPLSLTVDMR